MFEARSEKPERNFPRLITLRGRCDGRGGVDRRVLLGCRRGLVCYPADRKRTDLPDRVGINAGRPLQKKERRQDCLRYHGEMKERSQEWLRYKEQRAEGKNQGEIPRLCRPARSRERTRKKKRRPAPLGNDGFGLCAWQRSPTAEDRKEPTLQCREKNRPMGRPLHRRGKEPT